LTCANAESGQILDRCSRCRFVRVVPPRFLPHSLPHTNRCACCPSPSAAVTAMRLRRRWGAACEGSRVEGNDLPRGGQDFVCQRRDLRWNLSERPAWLWNYAYRPGPLKGRARRSRSCRGTRSWRCRTGSYAGGSSVLSICGRDGEGNAPALPGPAGLPRTNRHAAPGRPRTRRYQSARGDPGRKKRRSVRKTGGCRSSPSSTPSAAADRGR
jgi:hypothetical protein